MTSALCVLLFQPWKTPFDILNLHHKYSKCSLLGVCKNIRRYHKIVVVTFIAL